jgi:carbon storage regulator CsrA
MLVLSRKVGQEIFIGDNVRITVTKVSGNRVTLGVEAPDHVRILRGELQPIACAFEDDEEIVPDVLAQTVALMDEVVCSIPFVSNVTR